MRRGEEYMPPLAERKARVKVSAFSGTSTSTVRTKKSHGWASRD